MKSYTCAFVWSKNTFVYIFHATHSYVYPFYLIYLLDFMNCYWISIFSHSFLFLFTSSSSFIRMKFGFITFSTWLNVNEQEFYIYYARKFTGICWSSMFWKEKRKNWIKYKCKIIFEIRCNSFYCEGIFCCWWKSVH